MPEIRLSVPDDLLERMKDHPAIDWDDVAIEALYVKVDALEGVRVIKVRGIRPPMRTRLPAHKYWEDGDDPAERLIKRLAYWKKERSRPRGRAQGHPRWEP